MTHPLQFPQLPISVPHSLGFACGIPESVRYFALFHEGAAAWVDAGWLRLECDYWNVFVPLIEHRVTRLHLFEVDAEIGEGSINSHALIVDQQGGVYVGHKQEVWEALRHLNPAPRDPNAVMLRFIEEHYTDIPLYLKALVHGHENLFIRNNTKIKDSIIQHLDRQSNSLPSRNISEINCERVLEALRTEAKTNFLDWLDEQHRFSEILLNELQDIPDGLPENLCVWWKAVELKFRTYHSQAVSQRQEIASKAYKLFHKLPFFQKIYLHKQAGGNYCLDFTGMDLRKTNVENLSLQKANFSKADLEKANFRGGLLSDAVFKDANLAHSRFTSTNLDRSVFQGANLSNTIFNDACLINADFSNANLTSAKFIATNLNQAVFRGANLTDTVFDDVCALNADFSNSVGDYEIVESDESDNFGSYSHPRSYSRSGYYSGYHVSISDESSMY